MNELWTALAARAAVTLSPAQHQSLGRYLDLLIAANQTMNLTRITDRPAAEILHVGDALTLLPLLPAGQLKVVDVGTGGGVPGIPLAIARPDLRVTLVEATQKKTRFLAATVQSLALDNVRVLAERAECVGQTKLRESFDVATARAVATLDWLAEWCLPLVKVGGKMLAMKGKRADEEQAAAGRTIRTVGGGDVTAHPVELPGTQDLVIIEIRKVRQTPQKYPRLPTAAKGRPIT